MHEDMPHIWRQTSSLRRESEVYPERPQMEKKITNAPITPIRLLPGDSSPLVVINTADTRGGEEIHSRGGGGLVRKDTSPYLAGPVFVL